MQCSRASDMVDGRYRAPPVLIATWFKWRDRHPPFARRV